jgi:hypothetical protein
MSAIGHRGVLVLLGLAAVLSGAHAARADQDETRRRHEAAIANPFDAVALAAYVKTLPRDGDRYIVEGDILLAESEIRPYLAAKQVSAAPADERELIVNRHSGQVDYWRRDDRELTYAVARDTFPSADRYRSVVEDMRRAAGDWQDACPECGLRFRHVPEQDARPSLQEVRFVVRHHDVQGRYIAAAFFPHQAPAERWVNIDPSYFAPTLRFDRVGVLRHELGHVLGYRHEHTRGVPGCWFEDQQWMPLTTYDPHSLMHYFCGGAGSVDLALTASDREGHRALYGRDGVGTGSPPAGLVAPAPGDDVRAAYRAALGDPFDADRVATWKKTLPQVGDLYVVEGDIRLAESELVPWLAGKSAAPVAARSTELLVNRHGGRDDYWGDPAQRDLTYAVDRASFADEAKYVTVVRNVAAAAREWSEACPGCRLTIRHLPEHDARPSHEKVTFIVRSVDARGAFIAAAFFPHDAPARRYLDVDSSYFKTGFDTVGVFRHELGHALGYRHEHVRGEAGCWPENGEWRPLTDYDSRSVMHYFCNGGGSMRLDITDVDRRGHRRLYGSDTPESSACERPAPGSEGLLIVRLQGGDPATDAARTLEALGKAGALPTRPYRVRRNDTLCSIYRLPLGGCPRELQAAARAVGGKKVPKRLPVGSTLRVPDGQICFRPYRYSRYFDPSTGREGERAEELKRVWSSQVIRQETDGGLERVDLRGFELAVPLSAAGARERGARNLAALDSTSVRYEVVHPRPAPKARFELPPKKFREPADRYLNGGSADGEADYFDVLPGERPPSCTPACAGADCPSVVIVDTEIADHPEIAPALVRRDAALRPLPPPPPPPTASAQCHRTSFDAQRHHGTHMAGIIASRANSLGFQGLVPSLHVENERWAADVFDAALVDRLRLRQDKGLDGVYLFASRFDYPSARVRVNGDELVGGEDIRFASVAAEHIRNSEQLWVVAAGNRDDDDVPPVALRRTSAWAPMNLGSLKNVVVVTACDPCDDTHARLLPRANYSTERLVHVAAPGMPVAGLVTAAECAEAGGTSQAAAFVAGIAGAMRSCFPQAYQHPQEVKTRLELTARPVLPSHDAAKLTAGVVDGRLAVLDPRRSWLLPPAAKTYQPVSIQHWCADELKLKDVDTGSMSIVETKNVQRILRYRRDPNLNAWVVITRVRLSYRDIGVDSRGFLLQRSNPVRLNEAALVQVEGDPGPRSLSELDDLVLDAPVPTVSACA